MKAVRNLGLAAVLMLAAASCSSSDDEATTETDSEALAAEDTTTTVVAAATTSSATSETTAAPTTSAPDETAPAAPADGGSLDDCLIGSWNASPDAAQAWAAQYAANLVAADPVASGATVTIDAAAFSSEFRADGTGTNSSSIAGTATHPLGTGAATLQSTSVFQWAIDGDGLLVFTYSSGTVDNQVTINGLTVPFAGSVPTAGETSTVPYTCSDTALQADFSFGGLATGTPEMLRSS